MSTARDALSAHIQKMTQLRAAAGEARAPLADTDSKIEAAKADLAAAESAHDAGLRAEAEAFVSGQDATAATADVAAKAADVDRLRRQLAALVASRTEQENTLRDRQTTLSIADSGFETLVANVLAEVGADVAAELLDAGTKFAAAQSKAKSLVAYAVERHWFPLGEKLNTAFNSIKVPTWQASAHPDWKALAAALASDPNAPVQP
jgi:hypothetical protein